ncbi:hypothetical protein C8Q78DRAFT_198519 [Trametes maxima]|nr:hypothetical protein C8Q78DRAFT_198519 [Trametes maxima]
MIDLPQNKEGAARRGSLPPTSAPSPAHVATRPAQDIPSTSAAPPEYTLYNDAPQPPPSSIPTGVSGSRTLADDERSSQSSGKREHGAASALGKGLYAIGAAPVVFVGAGLAAMLAVLYGAGKLIEGLGKGVAIGPEVAYKAYKDRDARKAEKKAAKKKGRSRS